MLQELILWGTIGALLSAIGYSFTDWQFWCFMGTYWCVSFIARQRGRIEGMIDYLEMSEQDQRRIKQVLQKIKEEEL